MGDRELRSRPRQSEFTLQHEMRFPHSLGLLYSAFTYYCGFTVNSGEYKLMGLAPYGEPTYVDLILEKLIDLKEDGSSPHGHVVLQLLPGPDDDIEEVRRTCSAARRASPMRDLTKRDMDIAASIQKVTEEIMLRMARHVHERPG